MAFHSFALLLSFAFFQRAAAQDPCTAIAGKVFVPPADARACLKSFPFNETLRQNVLANANGVLNFFTFEPYYINSPPPFEESTQDIRGELNRMSNTAYETDYDFNWDLYVTSSQYNDGHTRWFPTCYTTFQNLLPAPIISLSVDGVEDVYVTPDLVELVALVGDDYKGYFDSIGFDYARLAGAKVISIEGRPAYDYVDYIAKTYSGNYLDHGVRVNSVFTSYRISAGDYGQRFGDFAGPSGVEKDSVELEVLLPDSYGPETITVPYLASFGGVNFTDGASYWANNCAATEETNGHDYKDVAVTSAAFKKREPKLRQPKGIMLDARNATAIGLPDEYHPTLPPVANATSGVIKSYILAENNTGVMFVGSFSPSNFNAFQYDVVAALDSFKQAGVTNLIIDLTNNGGGYVCLGDFLFQYLAGASQFPYSGFESTSRGNELAQKILAADIALGLNSSFTFYTADNYAFLNGTIMPADYNYFDPLDYTNVNGLHDPLSQRYHDTCEVSYVVDMPAEPPFALENIGIVGNGNCASTCAMFSALMYEQIGTKIAIFGGKPGEQMEYKGMAGNQVLDWADLASEIKTADLENDPLSPPDLYIDGDFRVNWRTGYSWIEKELPIAYRSEHPQYRFPYTNATYNNPQNLWEFAEKTFFF
ncbi:hypothetical protein CYLTODRAFT_488261, partial [Cylindrobasidium torrendii FP15055 ss-10]